MPTETTAILYYIKKAREALEASEGARCMLEGDFAGQELRLALRYQAVNQGAYMEKAEEHAKDTRSFLKSLFTQELELHFTTEDNADFWELVGAASYSREKVINYGHVEDGNLLLTALGKDINYKEVTKSILENSSKEKDTQSLQVISSYLTEAVIREHKSIFFCTIADEFLRPYVDTTSIHYQAIDECQLNSDEAIAWVRELTSRYIYDVTRHHVLHDHLWT